MTSELPYLQPGHKIRVEDKVRCAPHFLHQYNESQNDRQAQIQSHEMTSELPYLQPGDKIRVQSHLSRTLGPNVFG